MARTPRASAALFAAYEADLAARAVFVATLLADLLAADVAEAIRRADRAAAA